MRKRVEHRRGSTHDIIVGERPAGRVGGVLLVQQKSKKYQERERDVPILLVFFFNALRKVDRERMDRIGFPIAEETPVFKVNDDKFVSSLGGDED